MNLRIGLQGINAGRSTPRFATNLLSYARVVTLCGPVLTCAGGAMAAATSAPTNGAPVNGGSLPQAETARSSLRAPVASAGDRTRSASASGTSALAPSSVSPPKEPVASPLSGPTMWLSYLNGSSLRSNCGSEAADTYRFVYNADFTQQVRTYDVTLPHDGRPGVFMARVTASGGGGLGSYRSNVWAQRTMSRNQVEPVLRALAKSGFGTQPRSQASLRSDAFYWVVSACVNGAFRMSAWTPLATDQSPAEFAAELFSLDDTAVPVRLPAKAGPAKGTFWGDAEAQTPEPPEGQVFKVELTGGRALSLDR